MGVSAARPAEGEGALQHFVRAAPDDHPGEGLRDDADGILHLVVRRFFLCAQARTVALFRGRQCAECPAACMPTSLAVGAPLARPALRFACLEVPVAHREPAGGAGSALAAGRPALGASGTDAEVRPVVSATRDMFDLSILQVQGGGGCKKGLNCGQGTRAWIEAAQASN